MKIPLRDEHKPSSQVLLIDDSLGTMTWSTGHLLDASLWTAQRDMNRLHPINTPNASERFETGQAVKPKMAADAQGRVGHVEKTPTPRSGQQFVLPAP